MENTTLVMNSMNRTILEALVKFIILTSGMVMLTSFVKFLLDVGVEKNRDRDTKKTLQEKELKRDRTIKEYLNRNESLQNLGFTNKIEIFLYCPYRKCTWIEEFSIDLENSSVTVTDQHNRTYSCSIDNIQKIKTTDLMTQEIAEETLSSYHPEDEFWLPKDSNSEELEQEDWCDF